MRILHTADWHLGRLFYERHLTNDQAYILLGDFMALVKEASVDVVVIAGDVYDRAVPPVEAVALWNEVLTKLACEIKIPVCVIGGNHDSGERLGFGRELLRESHVYIEGYVHSGLHPFALQDEHGPVWFCPMPFAETPTLLAATGNGENRASYEKAYRLWSEYLLTMVPDNSRRIAVAHAFVSGGNASASERPLTLGGAETVSGNVFLPYHYAALGHLHGPQQVGRPEVRYSGSLLKYSFDEHRQKKSISIVDMDATGNVKIELVPIQPLHDVRILEGTFEDLYEGSRAKLERTNKDTLEDYILARITDTAPIVDGLARLRKVYPNVLSLEPVGRMANEETVGAYQLKKLSHQEIFREFAKQVWKKELSPDQEQLSNDIWNEVNREEP